MKVKALRVAAYLLMANFLLIVALNFAGQATPDYGHFVVLVALLVVATAALFSPRKKGWLGVVAYAMTHENEQRIVVDSPLIAALIIVFNPANFAAFSTPPAVVPTVGA